MPIPSNTKHPQPVPDLVFVLHWEYIMLRVSLAVYLPPPPALVCNEHERNWRRGGVKNSGRWWRGMSEGAKHVDTNGRNFCPKWNVMFIREEGDRRLGAAGRV